MKCPKCQSELKITHCYISDNVEVRREVCTQKHCRTIVITQKVVSVVAINPAYGDGATAYLKRLQKNPSEERSG